MSIWRKAEKAQSFYLGDHASGVWTLLSGTCIFSRSTKSKPFKWASIFIYYNTYHSLFLFWTGWTDRKQHVRLLLLEDGRCSRSALDWRSVYRLWMGPDLIGHCRASSMLWWGGKNANTKNILRTKHGKFEQLETSTLDSGYSLIPIPLDTARFFTRRAKHVYIFWVPDQEIMWFRYELIG